MRQERQEPRGHEPRDPAHGPRGAGVPIGAEAALCGAGSSGRATPQVFQAGTQKFDGRLLPARAGAAQLPWQRRQRAQRPDLGKSREGTQFSSGGTLPRWRKLGVGREGCGLALGPRRVAWEGPPPEVLAGDRCPRHAGLRALPGLRHSLSLLCLPVAPHCPGPEQTRERNAETWMSLYCPDVTY